MNEDEKIILTDQNLDHFDVHRLHIMTISLNNGDFMLVECKEKVGFTCRID